MYTPPTILPTDLRTFVDPPPCFPEVSDTPTVLVSAPRRSHLRAIPLWSRQWRKPAGRPCEAAAD